MIWVSDIRYLYVSSSFSSLWFIPVSSKLLIFIGTIYLSIYFSLLFTFFLFFMRIFHVELLFISDDYGDIRDSHIWKRMRLGRKMHAFLLQKNVMLEKRVFKGTFICTKFQLFIPKKGISINCRFLILRNFSISFFPLFYYG